MFNRHSIKFKLFVIVSIIILTFLGVFVLAWFLNTYNVNQHMVQITDTIYQESSEKTRIELRNENDRHMEHYFKLASEAISLDAYHANYDAVQEKLMTFLNHDGVCSIEVVDIISSKMSASVKRNCSSFSTFKKDIPVFYKKELIATLKIEYRLDFIEDKVLLYNAYLKEQFTHLRTAISEVFLSHFYIQMAILFMMASFMLLFVWRQIHKSVVKPLENVLKQMQSFEKSGTFTMVPNNPDKTEIGQLSSYFHHHIAKLLHQLTFRANHDAITHLYSRQKLLDDLALSQEYLLAVIDLEDFKEINNFFGVDIGDAILKETGKKIVNHFKDFSLNVYRINSDEFALVCLDYDSFALLDEEFNIFATVFSKEEFHIDGNVFSFNVAIGMAYAQETPIKSISAALTALKYSKNTKESVTLYTQQLPLIKQYEKNIAITSMIKDAIKKSGILPYFQPIFSHKEGRIVKYEALMRMNHEGTIVAPMEFLEVAKKTNTYHHLSEQMILKVIKHLQLNKECMIALNLNIRDIARKEFCLWLFSIIKQYDAGERITFEITEQEGIENFDRVREFIVEAKSIGICIAIDDFGSGYSNFEHLIHLHVDYLKIDGSLIKNITTDRNAQIIVETILLFAKKLGIQTVAEYVCSEEIFNYLHAIGIDYSQGYFIGKPEPKFQRNEHAI